MLDTAADFADVCGILSIILDVGGMLGSGDCGGIPWALQLMVVVY